MYRRHGNKLGLVFLGWDLLLTTVAWCGAYLLRFTWWDTPHGVPDAWRMLDDLPFVLLAAAVSYRAMGLYEIHRLRQLPRELGVVCRAAGLLFLLAALSTFYRRDIYESRLALLLFLALNVMLLAGGRRLLWQALKALRRRGLNHGRAIVIGSGRTGRQVAATIRSHHWTGLELIGYVDRPGLERNDGLPLLGDMNAIEHVIRQHDVDHVFIALPLSRYGELPGIYRALGNQLVDVQLVPEIPDLAGMKLRNVEIDELSFLSLRENPHRGWHVTAKRALDLTGAIAATILLSPLMLGLAIAIKLTSPGPVFYCQPRVGLGGRTFRMIKFRSMRTDAEAASGPVWATAGDDRCTPLGRIMRRWSLDELPQLFNVLAGDMSLVGPRPERDVFTAAFQRQLPSYMQRHAVKVGMTGWAQVNGWRGNTSIRRRLECDLYYICNWSLTLDLKILWLTVWRGLRHRHAY